MLYILEKVRLLSETNSSSSHSFTSNMSPNTIDKVREEIKNFLKENDYKLVFHPEGETYFGWEFTSYSDWKDIWNWLLIALYDAYYKFNIWNCEKPEVEVNNPYALDLFISKLNEFIGEFDYNLYEKEEYTKTICKLQFPYIDHQSSYLPFEVLDYYDLENIFTGTLYTGNDNV